MSNLIESVADHLNSLDLRFQMTRDGLGIDICFRGENTTYEARIAVLDGLLSIRSASILLLPCERRAVAVALVNRINAERLRWGAFWVDPHVGDLIFELASPVADELAVEQVAASVAAIGAIDVFFPAFAKVAWAGCSDAEALQSTSRAAPTAAEDLELD